MVPNLNSADVTWAINFLEQNATEYCMTRGLIQDIAQKANEILMVLLQGMRYFIGIL